MKKHIGSYVIVFLLVLLLFPIRCFAQEKEAGSPVSFILLMETEVSIGTEQQIVVGFDGGTTEISSEQLLLSGPNGSEIVCSGDKQAEDAVLFTIPTDGADCGNYRIKGISWTENGIAYSYDPADWGMNPSYEVTEETLSSEEEALSGLTVNGITADGTLTGNTGDEPAVMITDQLTGAASRIGSRASTQAYTDTKNGPIVVVIDPGHDKKHAGAQATHNGVLYQEENLVFNIAGYCVERLETYSNITVYKTRNSLECPYPGLSSKEDNQKRAEFGASVHADYQVAIHLNSSTSSSPSGSEVYYPNANYASSQTNPAVDAGENLNVEGKGISESILRSLTALGLQNRGAQIHNSQNGERFPDGTLCDYYALVRAPKLLGITGIIVESAFLSNAGDVSRYIKTEASRKQLGYAIADGIASYLKLEQKPLATPVVSAAAARDGISISWSNSGAAKYRVYRKKNSESSWSAIATVSGRSYTDRSVTSGASYKYTVRCLNEAGNVFRSDYDHQGASVYYLSEPSMNSPVWEAKGLRISWKAVSGAEGYYVYRRTAGTSWVRIGQTAEVSHLDTTGVSGTDYYYCVRAYKGSNRSAFDPVGKQQRYLSSPQLTLAENKTAGIRIKWNAVTGASLYRVYRKENSGWVKLLDTKNTYAIDTTAESGTGCRYTVRCLNSTGKLFASGYDTAGISLTRLSTPVLKKPVFEAAGCTISWNAVSGADSYRVYRRTGNEDWKLMTITSELSYTNTAGNSGTTYDYTIRACKGIERSDFDPVGVSFLYLSIPKLSEKSAAEAQGNRIVWEASRGAAKYRVYRRTSGNSWTGIGDTTETSFLDSGAEIGVKYYYTVRCITEKGDKHTSGYDTRGITLVR